MTERPLIIGASALGAATLALQKYWLDPTAEEANLESAIAPDDNLRHFVAQGMPGAVAALQQNDRGDGVLVAPDDALTSLLQSFLAERGLSNRQAFLDEGKLRSVPGDGLEAMFDDRDIAGWILRFLPSWLKGRFHKLPFPTPRETVGTLGNNARIAVLGDWGTGMYGAPVAATTIEKTAQPYDVLLHLGDVYYAGTSDEVAKRFLGAWPKVAGAANFALNSNHEMYSGGQGYFGLTLKDRRFAQGSSCFALQNDHFLLLGLDTAYSEHELIPTEIAWIHRRAAEAGSRKIILFSHHQPFSQFESGGDKLIANLRELLSSKRVLAWYWGHEHRCVLFDRHPIWGFSGRCIGHSGFPSFRDRFHERTLATNPDGSVWYRLERTPAPGARVLDGTNPYVDGHESKYAPNGFLSLTLDGPIIRETICSPDGTVLYQGAVEG